MKLLSLREAVARFVPDGASVVMGANLEALIPFAAGHEIIRQGKRDLTLVGPISDMLFDQLIGAGCVAEVIAAWVGNVSAGLGHCYRRAVEKGMPRPIRVVDHSNLSIALALQAAATGSPFIPTRSLMGTGLHFETIEWKGERYAAVPALRPDVAILAVQRADAQGGAHMWGNLGLAEEAAVAAQRVILCAEEVVPRSAITADPNRVLCPDFKVAAVCHTPGGCRPSPVQDYYDRDHAAYHAYHERSRTADGFTEWLQEAVHGR